VVLSVVRLVPEQRVLQQVELSVMHLEWTSVLAVVDWQWREEVGVSLHPPQ
jgi:hypothetical protein